MPAAEAVTSSDPGSIVLTALPGTLTMGLVAFAHALDGWGARTQHQRADRDHCRQLPHFTLMASGVSPTIGGLCTSHPASV
jgi:hypothetical protein